MADLQGFDGGRSPNEPEQSEGNLQTVSNPVFCKKRPAKRKNSGGETEFTQTEFAFCKDYSRTLEKKQKKWQTYKDSNLDKVNQNHLCYRYTIGLRADT